MTIREIIPTGPVSARILVPGSKSITNRALICAALAQGESVIHNASDSNDTALMANGLNQLGILARKSGLDLVVDGKGGRLYGPKFPIPVGNAGTTLRFLISLAALAEGNVTFEGDPRMGERPIAGLLEALSMLGVESKALDFASRYTVTGGTFMGGTARIRGDISSQFVSSLLMVAPYAKNDVFIELDGEPVSDPYIEMTIDIMNRFGVKADRIDKQRFRVRSGQRYGHSAIDVEADWSSAAYFLAAAAIAGGEVNVEGVKSESSQGDVRILEILRRMGCETEETETGVRIRGAGRLSALDLDLGNAPDLVPTVAVIGLFADGKTRIRNVAHLKSKESDRLEALSTELRKLGARVMLLEDGLEMEPAPLKGAQLDTYNDHRLAMSFALIGLRVPGIRIENPDCVRKSFPRFWEEFERLHKK